MVYFNLISYLKKSRSFVPDPFNIPGTHLAIFTLQSPGGIDVHRRTYLNQTQLRHSMCEYAFYMPGYPTNASEQLFRGLNIHVCMHLTVSCKLIWSVFYVALGKFSAI